MEPFRPQGTHNQVSDMTVNVNVKLDHLVVELLKDFIAKATWRLDKLMATLQERFDAVSAKLDEASTEILAEIAKLKLESLTPEGEAALAALEAKANALADISPPAA